MAGDVPSAHFEWVPALGLAASFFIDPLGLMFAGMILGIGLLIIIYARFYVAAGDSMGRFLSFLLLFQGAMLGIVISVNVRMMLAFLELKIPSSFLLIGFCSLYVIARQGARMALVVRSDWHT